MTVRIITLPGDGVGPEVVAEAVKVLHAVAGAAGESIAVEEHLIGGASIDATGEPIASSTIAACTTADAVLLGAVGGPRWSDPQAAARPEDGLLRLRKELGLYTNLRPTTLYPALADASPLKKEIVAGVDLLIVRELTGGLYFGLPRGEIEDAAGKRTVDTMVYSEAEIERVVRVAFEAARGRRKKLTSVDKANVLATSRLWRRVATTMAAAYPDVALDHMLVDSMAMRLITAPASFDVIVTENMFGDILSDEASVLGGSLGLAPSASLGAGRFGLYEPIHGSAPDIAGLGVANPLGTIRSVALLLRMSLGWEAAARGVEAAVARALDDGLRTADIAGAGPSVSTSTMGDAIVSRLD